MEINNHVHGAITKDPHTPEVNARQSADFTRLRQRLIQSS